MGKYSALIVIIISIFKNRGIILLFNDYITFYSILHMKHKKTKQS